MPICICPECSKSHKISAKNLGLKGRCTRCRVIFTLVEHQDVPPPAPAFIPPPPAADPQPAFEPDTFSLRHPEPPAPPAVPKPPEPEESAEDAWMDEIDFNDEDDAPGPNIITAPESSKSCEVASLPSRFLINLIATGLYVIGAVGTIIGVLALLLGVLVYLSEEKHASAQLALGVSILIPSLVALCVSEFLSILISVEARLHEISKKQN